MAKELVPQESSKELQAKEELVYTPAVDIFETDKEFTILADMPGVKPKDLNVEIEENLLIITGEVQPPEESGERDIVREYRTGRYFRQFTLSDAIDQSKLEARQADGVLRLALPKVEAVKPRKITVKTA